MAAISINVYFKYNGIDTNVYSIKVANANTSVTVYKSQANSSTGLYTISSTIGFYSDSYITLTCTTDSGYSFSSWTASGNAAWTSSINNPADIYVTGDFNIRAMATQNSSGGGEEPSVYSYSIIYDNNGGANGPGTITTTSAQLSLTHYITSIEPNRNGYNFLGWSKTSTDTVGRYNSGDTLTIYPGETKLFAIWGQSSSGGGDNTTFSVEFIIQDVPIVVDSQFYSDTITKSTIVSGFNTGYPIYFYATGIISYTIINTGVVVTGTSAATQVSYDGLSGNIKVTAKSDPSVITDNYVRVCLDGIWTKAIPYVCLDGIWTKCT